MGSNPALTTSVTSRKKRQQKLKPLDYIKNQLSDFPGGTVVKNPPANAGDTGSVPGLGKIPHAVEQLSLCTTTAEPVCCNY